MFMRLLKSKQIIQDELPSFYKELAISLIGDKYSIAENGKELRFSDYSLSITTKETKDKKIMVAIIAHYNTVPLKQNDNLDEVYSLESHLNIDTFKRENLNQENGDAILVDYCHAKLLSLLTPIQYV